MARLTTRWLVRGGMAELNLTQSDALVLIALLDHEQDGIAWIPQTHLRDHLGIARSTIQASIARLLETGAILEHEPGRQGRATRYRFGDLRELKPARSSGTFAA